MIIRSDARLPTGTTLQVPRALAHGRLPSGLTAPSLRAFIVMLAHADQAGDIDLMKPELVELSGTRIDAAHKFLEPLRASSIATADGHALDGDAWFDDIEYRPGERTRYAGVVRASLSTSARDVLADPTVAGTIPAPVDEFRRLTTIPGILLYLRLREAMAGSPNAKALTMRAQVEDLYDLFGIYSTAAASRKANAVGEISATLNLSRMTATLLRPAIADIGKALDGHALDLVEGKVSEAGRGVRWRHVDIVLQRLAPKKTMKDLKAEDLQRRAYLERIGRP